MLEERVFRGVRWTELREALVLRFVGRYLLTRMTRCRDRGVGMEVKEAKFGMAGGKMGGLDRTAPGLCPRNRCTVVTRSCLAGHAGFGGPEKLERM